MSSTLKTPDAEKVTLLEKRTPGLAPGLTVPDKTLMVPSGPTPPSVPPFTMNCVIGYEPVTRTFPALTVMVPFKLASESVNVPVPILATAPVVPSNRPEYAVEVLLPPTVNAPPVMFTFASVPPPLSEPIVSELLVMSNVENALTVTSAVS